jgi:hypothetical integral membrane protein (TIGR02206 family)
MLGVGYWMFPPVSSLQLFFIILTFAAPAVVWLYARREPDGRVARCLERGLALALLAFYAADLTMKWQDDAFTLDNVLPMQLCDWALFAIGAALWYRWRICFEVAYFWGLAGTFQALFTPAIPADLAWFRKFGFFFIHAGIVIGILHLLATVRWRPTPRSLLHVIVASEFYLGAALLTNALTDGNYGFLSHKPTTASMLDLFSDNPTLYVVQINLTAFVFFAVLYLPWLIIDLAHAKPKAANGDPATTSTRQA